MEGLSRRRLLGHGVLLGAKVLTGCGDDEPFVLPAGCEALAGGQPLGPAAWGEPTSEPFHQKVGSGLGARLFTDLASLTPNTLITPNDQFYIRTEFPSETLDPSLPYTVLLDGLVDAPVSVPIADLLALAQPHGPQLLECSGNFVDANFGLMSVADWAGVPIQALLDMVSIRPQATRVLVNGFDHLSGKTPGASWIFTFDQLLDAGAILATEMNGEPLPPDHGAPVRLLAPNWFGCCNIKWVDAITFVDDAAPSTPHMQEFAGRTLQNGVPALAADFIAATMDQTAVPTLVEKWRLDGRIVYRFKGVMWGGYQLTDSLALQLDDGELQPVTLCPMPTSNRSWTLWEHLWLPTATGEYLLRCHFTDPTIPQRRLESGRYDRHVRIDEV